MNIIFRYILKKYLFAILISTLVLLSINLLFAFIYELKSLGQHQYTLNKIFQYILFLIPQNLTDIFPFAILVGSILAFGFMSSTNEFLAMNSYGIGMKKLVFLILIMTFFVSSLFTLITNVVTPELSNKAIEIKNISLNKGIHYRDIWFKHNNSFINVGKIITDKNLRDIKIYNLDNSGKLLSVLSADSAIRDSKWEFLDVKITDLKINQISIKDRYYIDLDAFIPTYVLESRFTKKRFNSLSTLYKNIVYHNSERIYYEDHKVTFWQKIFLPITCCVLVFTCIPFIFKRIRADSQSKRVLFAILFGVSYFVISKILIDILLIINIPAIIAVLLSLAIFVMIGLYFFKKIISTEIPI